MRSFKQAIRGSSGDSTYDEYRLMEKLGWSYQDLMDCPYEEYLNYRRIMSLEGKEKAKQQKQQERAAKRRQ